MSSVKHAMEYEDIPLKKVNNKKEAKPEQLSHKDIYKLTKTKHKDAIRQLKCDIKRHKLLIKQAKLTYKLNK